MPNNRRRPAKVRAGTAKEISVLAWISDAFGQVFLVQQTAGRQLWSLPGGKVRSHEPIRLALRREIKEEIGLSVVSAKIIDVFDRPQKGALAILFQVVLRKGPIKLEAKEIKDSAFVKKLPAKSTPSVRYFWHRQFPERQAQTQRPCPLD
jgi:ADP-ribose pyrophosphatase YjhB (NUDIX family)